MSPPLSFCTKTPLEEKFIARGYSELELLLGFEETPKYRCWDDKRKLTGESTIARNKEEL
jgi:hypothetical protein